ncbi:MAG: SprT-like domain-containing protein [Chromatiaceae bacterium]|nr:SprT-like domain-containing protein [Chromatiaceae bacterium]MCP5445062.1 SprT-like domain-containing protein [Chromatiaceae bacterium]
MSGRDPNLEEQTKQFTLALLRQAGAHFGVILHPVDIRFDLRGKAAGMLRFTAPGEPVIRYNRALLEQYRDEFIKQTVPHEVAHLVVAALHPHRTAPHGPEWRMVISFFGAEPKRCHNFQVDESVIRRLPRFRYRCGCREHMLTSIRRNRIARGESYYCRHCGKLLKPD